MGGLGVVGGADAAAVVDAVVVWQAEAGPPAGVRVLEIGQGGLAGVVEGGEGGEEIPMADLNFSAALDDRAFRSKLDGMGRDTRRAADGIQGILRFSMLKQGFNMVWREGAEAMRAWAQETERGRVAMENLERGARRVKAALGERTYEFLNDLPGIGQGMRWMEEQGRLALELERGNQAIEERHRLMNRLRDTIDEMLVQQQRENPQDNRDEAIEGRVRDLARRKFMEQFPAKGLPAQGAQARQYAEGMRMFEERAVDEYRRAVSRVGIEQAREEDARLRGTEASRQGLRVDEERRRIDIARLRGEDLLADRKQVELEYEQRILEVKRDQFLTDQEKAEAEARLLRLRDQTLGLLGDRRGPTGLVNLQGGLAGLNRAVVQQTVGGSGGIGADLKALRALLQQTLNAAQRVANNTAGGNAAVMGP